MKNVVITGGTRGIGRGLATEFLRRNCRVVITGRDRSQVNSVVAELGAEHQPDNIAGIDCEVSSCDDLNALWSFAANNFGNVDIWINNAGVSIVRKPLHEQSAEDLQTIVSTNLTGALLASKVAIAGMHAQGSGQLWNMEGFGSGDQTAVGMVAYGATKRAVTYLNKALQKEVKGSPVQVCSLSPGIVVTDLLIGDYDLESEEWKKAKKILNILGDTAETVTPHLVDCILRADKSGAKVAWLTTPKAFGRFMKAGFNKRDLFANIPGA